MWKNTRRYLLNRRGYGGVFSKDEDIEKCIESRQAAGAFVRVLYAFMNMYTIEDCRQMIDDFARNE